MAWTNTISCVQNADRVEMNKNFTFKIVCVSDGNALSTTLLSAMDGWSSLSLEQQDAIRRGRFNSLTSVPGSGGAAPLATYTVTIYNGLGAPILSVAGLSITATEINNVANVMGFFPFFQGVPSLAITDLGDTSDQTTLYLEVIV